jgi:methyltransferase (TIGR00027 family)
MIAGQPSRTAVRAALRRAAHQVLDTPVVFEDPLALTMIGKEVAAALLKAPEKLESQAGAPALRAFLAVRARIAEAAIEKAHGRGVRQVVILGAGLDTFAYRNPYADVRVFEVDHPSTQEWKRLRLKDVGLAEPASVTFVPVDAEKPVLAESLVAAGLDPAAPAFCSWLGVTPYLATAAVWQTLEAVAALAAGGGGVTFDYVVPPAALNFFQRARFAVLAQRVSAAGEPFQTFFDPAGLHERLRAIGFDEVRDRGPADLNRKYFDGRADGLHVGGMGHVLTAWRA